MSIEERKERKREEKRGKRGKTEPSQGDQLRIEETNKNKKTDEKTRGMKKSRKLEK